MRHATGLPVLLAFVIACSGADSQAPDVLLVTVDTLRADHVGAYGYHRPTTPRIDRLASEGATFEVVYAPMGTTGPSHATLFTSRFPDAHGVVRNGIPLIDAEVTLAETMSLAGYQTAAFVSSFPVSEPFGFEQASIISTPSSRSRERP